MSESDPIVDKFISRDLSEISIYAKAYAVGSYETIQRIQRFIQDYKEYLTEDDLRYCNLCLVEIGQVNMMAAKIANPLIQDLRKAIHAHNQDQSD